MHYSKKQRCAQDQDLDPEESRKKYPDQDRISNFAENTDRNPGRIPIFCFILSSGYQIRSYKCYGFLVTRQSATFFYKSYTRFTTFRV